MASDHIFCASGEDDGEDGDGIETHGSAENNQDKDEDTRTDSFQKLGLHINLSSALTNPNGHFQLSQPTIVQSRAISSLLPSNLNKRKENGVKKLEVNLFIQSETGSGKTLAYLLPILQVSSSTFRSSTRSAILKLCALLTLPLILSYYTAPISRYAYSASQKG